MSIFFILALLLAWPTYGLSLVVWLVVIFLKTNAKLDRSKRREEVKVFIEPLFEGRFSDFFLALDVPIFEWEEMSKQEAHQCGRYIMNYIAHNPTETAEFLVGLRKWRTKGGPEFSSPIDAAMDEVRFNAKGELHAVCYRAIETLVTKNKLVCFAKVDMLSLLEKKLELELGIVENPQATGQEATVLKIDGNKKNASETGDAASTKSLQKEDQIRVQVEDQLAKMGVSVLLVTHAGDVLMTAESLDHRPKDWLGGQVIEVVISHPDYGSYFIYYENKKYYEEMSLNGGRVAINDFNKFESAEKYRRDVSQVLCMYLILFVRKEYDLDLVHQELSFSHNKINANVVAYVPSMGGWYPIQCSSDEAARDVARKIAEVDKGIIDITDIIAMDSPSPA